MCRHRQILSAAAFRLCLQVISAAVEVEHQETAADAVHLTLCLVTAAAANLLRIADSTIITMTAAASLLIHAMTAADAATGLNLAAAGNLISTALFPGAVFLILIKLQLTTKI